jgi:hypothetical protein
MKNILPCGYSRRQWWPSIIGCKQRIIGVDWKNFDDDGICIVDVHNREQMESIRKSAWC